ncbi:hypothetical protein GcM3_210017 [Golovinomyces cichoracearum]|uniref:WW domain-containing protein n=1 Tax=Golovinomyces cichoracearum TaxID=62708 RepID=A0A420HA88_9PEZI|nr:hypothetical protein GcM3_210017 [Golovinomyces cichoracearum]
MSTTGQEGPSFSPPSLPEGWIAQWDDQSKNYYFVNMSTRLSQWEMPTHAAPTAPPYQNDSQSLKQQNNPYPAGENTMHVSNGKEEPGSSDRGLSGTIGQLAMNQLLGSGKKKMNSNNGGPLGALAGQLLGGSSHGGSHSKPSSSITGSLVSSLLGGKQPDKTSHHGSPQKPGHGGLMNTVSGLFTKNDKPNNYGYSQSAGGEPGNYSGSAPPNSYQPNNSFHSHQQANYHIPQQPQYHSNNHQNDHYHPHQNQFQQSPNVPPPNIGNSYNAPPPQSHQQQSYNQHGTPSVYQNPGNQQQNTGPHQKTYEYSQPLSPYQESGGSYQGSSHSNPHLNSGGYPSIGYPNSSHQNSQGGHSNGHETYPNSGGPPLPTGSHPNNGHQGTPRPPGRY